MQLLGVINSNLHRKYGAEAFLEPFIADMIKLQTGIELTIRSETRLWNAILVNFVGDMLASNFVEGFKRNRFSSLPCRFCLVH
jgi:hypothetical protein